MTNLMSGVYKANGIHIHYLRTGGCKPPLVLLHGLTGSGACWIPLARALEGEYDVLMPDARGHGNSRRGCKPEHMRLTFFTPPNPEYYELVGTIYVPILLVIGDNGVVSLETARELQNLNPRLRVEPIQDAGHGLPYDQPNRFEAVVRSFLRSVAAP
jgi:pimeloyl-ACP methyl ester carboxylesterase